MTKYRFVLSLSVVVALCFFSGGCGASRPAEEPVATPGESGGGDSSTATEPDAARIMEAVVNEKNLLLDGKPAAKDYLRQKLVGLLVKKLTGLGYDAGTSKSMASSGNLLQFSVKGHKEKIKGQGIDEGKIIKTVLWDVKGRLRVVLTDKDVARLGSILDSLPLNSIEQTQAVSALLDGYASFGPDKSLYSSLCEKVGNRWAGLLEPFLKVQLEGKPGDKEEFFTVLSRSADALKAFSEYHSRHAAFSKLERIFTLAALQWLKLVELNTSNHDRIWKMLGRLEKLADKRLPGLMPYLKRDLELNWRNMLNRLDDKKVPFPELKEAFLLFLEDFPESDFYPELELRFLARWVEYLVSFEAQDLDQLEQFHREVELLHKRFPSFSQLDEVKAALGKQCLAVLAETRAADLQAMSRINETLGKCDQALPAGVETMGMRQRLKGMEDELIRKRDDRMEKKALKGLTFFIDWDKAVRKLDWGGKRDTWFGQDDFASRWQNGRDAGQDCHCSLDPDEPCRVFEEEGPHGGFEVVARFYKGGLSGVDLCQVFVGSNVPAVYKFFSRRYRKNHDARSAAILLAGQKGEVDFGKPPGTVVKLACANGSCTIRYRDGNAIQAQLRDERAELERRVAERRKKRKDRIERGWKQRDCVKWGCDNTCHFEGEVWRKKGNRYLVTVTDSDEDPRAIGSRVWVNGKELYDCD